MKLYSICHYCGEQFLAEIILYPLGYFLENLRLQNIYSRIGKVTEHLAHLWLFKEARYVLFGIKQRYAVFCRH